jgi:hypothetical protein
MRSLPESFQQRGQGGFSGARSLGVAAHAVDYDQQRCLVGRRNRDPVLILFAVAD